MWKKTTQIHQNESALVSAARDGDRQALTTLLERHWSWLKALTYSILGSAHDVDDAMQELCVLVIDRIGTLREPERFRAWLATVARRNSFAFIRQMRTEPARACNSFDRTALILDPKNDPVGEAEKSEHQELFLNAMAELPNKYREAFILRHYNEMSYSDIADSLNLPVTTVQIRLVRARRMLANSLLGRPNHKVPRT